MMPAECCGSTRGIWPSPRESLSSAGFGGTPASAALDANYLYVVLTSSGGDTSRIVRLRRSAN